MVEDGGFFGHAEGVLGGHDVAELAEACAPGVGGEPGVDDAWVGADLEAFGVEVVLDGGEAPEAEVVGGLGEQAPFLEDLVVELAVAADGAEPLALLVGGRYHRVDLDDGLHHDVPPILADFCQKSRR